MAMQTLNCPRCGGRVLSVRKRSFSIHDGFKAPDVETFCCSACGWFLSSMTVPQGDEKENRRPLEKVPGRHEAPGDRILSS